MRIVCLFTLLFAAAVLALPRDNNLEYPYQKFRKQHIRKQMTVGDCNKVMNNEIKKLNEGRCKEINTFILADEKTVKSVCETNGEPYKNNMTKSLQPFNIIVCEKIKKVKKKCQYGGKSLNKKIVIKCVGYPVHYDKDIGHCET
ncbi:ribonuclease, liver-like [Embiotoca jacksoni]|uniref:ribonuclease, liver-like n=1 Tax=Embiotoca jacksoni TaxID=100190 RepID=UPI0037047A02